MGPYRSYPFYDLRVNPCGRGRCTTSWICPVRSKTSAMSRRWQLSGILQLHMTVVCCCTVRVSMSTANPRANARPIGCLARTPLDILDAIIASGDSPARLSSGAPLRADTRLSLLVVGQPRGVEDGVLQLDGRHGPAVFGRGENIADDVRAHVVYHQSGGGGDGLLGQLGVHVTSADGTPTFVRAPQLTDDDVQRIVETTAKRVVRLLQRRGVLEEGNVDPLWEDEPLLATTTDACWRPMPPTGRRSCRGRNRPTTAPTQAGARVSSHPRSVGTDWRGRSCWRGCSNSR